MTTLEITARKPKEAVKVGFIPAVFYGKKTASTPVLVSKIKFKKALHEAGESTVITLKGEKDFDAIIHDVQFDPVTDEPVHADFYVFEAGQKIEVEVPLVFEGVSPAVKDLQGILVKVIHDLPIKAEPKDLPHEIVVDISSLVDFESVIIAKDLKLPKGVELAIDPEDVIVSMAEPKEEPEEPAEPIDLSTIEVEKKGKVAEEGAEGEAEAPAETPEKKKE